MDYIQEELLRQRRILSVLMTGGQQREPEETGGGEDENLPAVQPAAERLERIRTVWETEPELRLQGRTGRSEPAAAGKRTAGFYSGGEAGRRGREAPAAEESVMPARMAMYEWTAPEAAADVRDISRSIQRDARRYDGGFSIY